MTNTFGHKFRTHIFWSTASYWYNCSVYLYIYLPYWACSKYKNTRMKFHEFNIRAYYIRSAILLRHYRTHFVVWRLWLYSVVKVFSMTRVQFTVANLRFSSGYWRGEDWKTPLCLRVFLLFSPPVQCLVFAVYETLDR